MTEREMEDLIADNPDDFFPHKGFKLVGRQQSFSGVGRFDLLFKDRFETNILMELKAVPAKYEVATQLAKYRDEMMSRDEKHILMWLVAPQISNAVREFLDRIGIEYSEIHDAEFQRVAERHGVARLVENEPSADRPTSPQGRVRHAASEPFAKTDNSNRSNAVYDNFRTLMESSVLPQHAASPSDKRLDESAASSFGMDAAFRFRHHGKVWKINVDTHYDRLIAAYDFLLARPSNDPFVESPTDNGTCLKLQEVIQRSLERKPHRKLLYIYEDSGKK